MGSFEQAREAYEASIDIAKELGDFRMVAVGNGQLGTLAMSEGNLQEAVQRFHEALGFFHQLNEPSHQAVYLNQLGQAFFRAKQWEAAEEAYRNSAQIKENQGDLAGAAQTWSDLALVAKSAGKPDEAEGWYRKAIEGFKKSGYAPMAHIAINNLADLLQNNTSRLQEARTLAEEAMAIKKALIRVRLKFGKLMNFWHKLPTNNNSRSRRGNIGGRQEKQSGILPGRGMSCSGISQ